MKFGLLNREIKSNVIHFFGRMGKKTREQLIKFFFFNLKEQIYQAV